MRELRGVIIEETEAAGTAGAMPVDTARGVLRAAIEQLMQDAIRFHEEAAEAQSDPAETPSYRIFNGPEQPNHSAIRITTGARQVRGDACRCRRLRSRGEETGHSTSCRGLRADA